MNQYIVLETFRKNGLGVKTPVWFAESDGFTYIWTESASGKAKRIRANGRARLAPSTASGEPLGAWSEASASADASPAAIRHVRALFAKKYGLMFHLFGLMGRLRRSQYTTIKIQIKSG